MTDGVFDLRPATHQAFARGAQSIKPELPRLTTSALCAEAMRSLTEAQAAYEDAGDEEGKWQTMGAMRALGDHQKAMGFTR